MALYTRTDALGHVEICGSNVGRGGHGRHGGGPGGRRGGRGDGDDWFGVTTPFELRDVETVYLLDEPQSQLPRDVQVLLGWR